MWPLIIILLVFVNFHNKTISKAPFLSSSRIWIWKCMRTIDSVARYLKGGILWNTSVLLVVNTLTLDVYKIMKLLHSSDFNVCSYFVQPKSTFYICMCDITCWFTKLSGNCTNWELTMKSMHCRKPLLAHIGIFDHDVVWVGSQKPGFGMGQGNVWWVWWGYGHYWPRN